MKLQKRNLIPVYYSLFDKQDIVYDEYGNETGSYKVTYKEPVMMMANVSPATGYVWVNTFGNSISYDKVLVTDDLDCPVDENTVFYIDRTPNQGMHDYVVRRVGKSLNYIAYALRKVDVSNG